MNTKIIAQSFIISSLLTFASLSVHALPGLSCESFFQTKVVSSIETDSKLYAKGINKAKSPEGHFQISYESEYLFSESGPLLRDYAPMENVIPKTEWLKLSDAQHIEWIKAKFGNKPEHATAAGLRRIVDVDFLPSELIVDSTGNLEIVINPPLDSYKDWERTVDYIVNKYGSGSQQAMISKPREAAFKSKENTAKLEEQHLGWLYYTNIFDMFEKLDSGYERFQKDPTKLTAQFFDHPFLGPMTKVKRDQLQKYLMSNAKLEMYDDASKNFVRKSDASFKYTGGPSYRPDIAGPVRWAWEIRNAHKDTKGLKAKVLRDLEAHADGLDQYEKFAKLPAFDTKAEYEKLPVRTQKFLKDIFPTKADARFEYTVDENLALETFRNFSMPFMNFEVLVHSTSEASDAKQNLFRARKARVEYFAGLNKVVTDFEKGSITKDVTKARVMGLLCKWSSDSGIFELLKKEALQLGHDKKNENLAKKAG